MRALFADGTNSWLHFLTGALGWRALAIGLLYQLATYSENTPIDIAEMVVGYVLRLALGYGY